MKDLQEATVAICDLKGSMLAMQAGLMALLRAIPLDATPAVLTELRANGEAAEIVLLNEPVSEFARAAFARELEGLLEILEARAQMYTLLGGPQQAR